MTAQDQNTPGWTLANPEASPFAEQLPTGVLRWGVYAPDHSYRGYLEVSDAEAAILAADLTAASAARITSCLTAYPILAPVLGYHYEVRSWSTDDDGRKVWSGWRSEFGRTEPPAGEHVRNVVAVGAVGPAEPAQSVTLEERERLAATFAEADHYKARVAALEADLSGWKSAHESMRLTAVANAKERNAAREQSAQVADRLAAAWREQFREHDSRWHGRSGDHDG